MRKTNVFEQGRFKYLDHSKMLLLSDLNISNLDDGYNFQESIHEYISKGFNTILKIHVASFYYEFYLEK